MGKIVVTQEQADRINYFRKDDESKGEAIRHHVNKWLSSVNTCLNELSVDELVRALYVGYEVEVEEQEPQFEVGDFAVNVHDGTVLEVINKITESGTYYEVVRCSSGLKESIHRDRLRHATESEIAEEEKRRTNVKIDGLLVGLSSGERVRLREKLECGDY